MLSDNDFILRSLVKHKKNAKKDEMDNGTDAISDIVKYQKKIEKSKRKNIKDWCNTDFLRYFDEIIKCFNISRVKRNSRSDSVDVSKIYDVLAKHLKEKMDNIVLKNYLEWWVNIFADKHSTREVYLKNLCNDVYISKYLRKYYNENICIKHTKNIEEDTSNIQDIYDMGGVGLCLIKKGIVSTSEFLQYNMPSVCGDEQMSVQYIKTFLEKMDKKTLRCVLDITKKNGPYNIDTNKKFCKLKDIFEDKKVFEDSHMCFESCFK